MSEPSDNKNHIVYHVAVCAEVQECGQRSVSVCAHSGPHIRKPSCTGIDNSCCMQRRGFIDEIWTVVCASLHRTELGKQ
jgi:hypothetical protein